MRFATLAFIVPFFMPLTATAQTVSPQICEASADIVTSVADLRKSGSARKAAEASTLDGLSAELQVLRPAVYVIVEDVYGWSDAQLAGYSRQDWLNQCLQAN